MTQQGGPCCKKKKSFSDRAAIVTSARTRQDKFNLKFLAQTDTPCLSYALHGRTDGQTDRRTDGQTHQFQDRDYLNIDRYDILN